MMKDADKTIQNTIEEGGEEEPPLEVSDYKMDFDTGECSIYIFASGRSIFPRQRAFIWMVNGDSVVCNVSSL
jgi:hypothetical protein